jgi:TPR repeat protein
MTKILQSLLLGLALAGTAVAPARAQDTLNLEDVLTLLRFNEGPREMVEEVQVAMVRSRCVSFRLTRESADRLHAVGMGGVPHRMTNSFYNAVRRCHPPEVSYEEGLMWLRGDHKWYQMSMWAFEHASGRGHAAAAYRVGVAIENWWGNAAGQPLAAADTAGRYRAALRWFHLAAERGYPVAMNGIARYHREGRRGVPRDPAEGMRWLQRGVELGFARSMVHVGYMHRNGEGMPVNHTEAVRWFQMAADAGDVWGYVHLAEAYEEGRGVRRDRNQARTLWRIVRDRGDAEQSTLAMNRLRRLGG